VGRRHRRPHQQGPEGAPRAEGLRGRGRGMSRYLFSKVSTIWSFALFRIALHDGVSCLSTLLKSTNALYP
jgi:hypothetical protein